MLTTPLLTESPAGLAALAHVSVLYTDLDGTLLAQGGALLSNAAGEPSVSTAESIVALRKAGLTVVPISGRNQLQMFELSRLVGWSDFIAELGCVFVTGTGAKREVTYNTGDWPEGTLATNQTPFEAIADSGAVDLLRKAFPGHVEYHAPWHHDREATHLLRGCLDAVEAQAVLDTLELPVAILDNGLIRPPAHHLTCKGDIHAYHLVPAGVSKEQALEFDLARRGLSRKDAAGIGDSATDLGMASAVGVMALVANGFDSTKLAPAIASSPAGNIVRLAGERGDGWVEFAGAWLAARQVE